MARFRARPRRCRSAVARWVLGWAVGIAIVAGSVEAGGAPPSPGATEATIPPGDVDVEIVGSSYTAGEDGGSTGKIYSVVLGNPRPAEARAYDRSHRLGMYAIDASLWTRVRPESDGHWRQTILKPPGTVAELEIFAVTPEVFKTEVLGEMYLLPHPFRDLGASDLGRIEYIVSYALGGTRAELRIGVTHVEAQAMVKRIRDVLREAPVSAAR